MRHIAITAGFGEIGGDLRGVGKAVTKFVFPSGLARSVGGVFCDFAGNLIRFEHFRIHCKQIK